MWQANGTALTWSMTLPSDPWGNAYLYAPPLRDDTGFERTPFVYTFGADEQRGGSGLNSDLGRVPYEG